jgi:hypothetical protein
MASCRKSGGSIHPMYFDDIVKCELVGKIISCRDCRFFED